LVVGALPKAVLLRPRADECQIAGRGNKRTQRELDYPLLMRFAAYGAPAGLKEVRFTLAGIWHGTPFPRLLAPS
jgi:hypothetical protein